MYSLRRDRRAAVAILVAAGLPAMLGATGLGIDLGVWYREAARLQLGADAGAIGAARLLAAGNTNQQDIVAAAWQAAQAATNNGRWWGSQAGVASAAVAANSSQVTVTLTSAADRYFTQVVGIGAPALKASATAGFQAASACVLALSRTAAPAIQVDNQGGVTATGCGIFADSGASNAIYLNSGQLKGTSIGAVGGVTQSNSGSNVMSPSPGTSNAPYEADPYASKVAPTPGACSYTNASFTAYQSAPYAFVQSQNVFCGNTTIGGNGTSDTFAPGIYFVVNGNLTFNNANVTQATGVTFVLTGTSPGAFSWTNYSNTYVFTAPTTGPTAGILIWQTCPSSGTSPANTFAGGSTLQISGEIYTPCGALDLSNNAQLQAGSGGSLGAVASQSYATGSAVLAAVAPSGGQTSGTSQVSLLQ